MGAREETLALLKRGLSPGQISALRNVGLGTTLGYLNQMVGEGKLRRSDIFFSIQREVRQAIADSSNGCPSDVSREDFDVVQAYGDGAHALGDMYNDLREMETFLHRLIKETLVLKYGNSEDGWWRRGIPEAIRKTCQVRREEDQEPAEEAYCYTDLLDLGRIIEANWDNFQRYLPTQYRSNRRRFLEDVRRLNGIRRLVMHPVRGEASSEDDFDFVRHFKIGLEVEFMREGGEPLLGPTKY